MSFIHIVPYAFDGKLADACNQAIARVDSEIEWFLLTDADVMFLTPRYGHLIQATINENREAGLITCVTNRIGPKAQLTEKGRMKTSNLLRLREIAVERERQFGTTVSTINAPISGLFMLFRRKVWAEIGGFKGDDLFGVDWTFSREIEAAGYPIYRMEGLFLVHFHRLDGKSAICGDQLLSGRTG
jgi:GT2 family glycosyltransferase